LIIPAGAKEGNKKMALTRWIVRTGTVLGILLIVGIAFAQEKKPEEAKESMQEQKANEKEAQSAKEVPVLKPEEVVVTGTRSPKDVLEDPFFSSVMGKGKIQEERLSRSLPEALSEETGVSVQKTGPAQSSPYIRGMTGYHTLLLIDGIRLNNSVFRSGPNQYWSTVDSYTVEKAEIVRGTSSVLYGSDALGGVVNAITRESLPKSQTVRAVYRFGSAEQSHTGRGELSLRGEETSLLLGGTYKSFGDLICGRHIGLQDNTSFDEWFGDFKLTHFLSGEKKFILAYYRAEQLDAPRTHKTDEIKSWHGTTVGTDIVRDFDQNRDLVYAQLHLDKQEGVINRAKFSLSFQNQNEEERIVPKASTIMEHIGFNAGTTGAWSELESKTCLGTLIYGFEFYHDSVNSYQFKEDLTTGTIVSSRPRGAVADDSAYDLAGIFLQDEIKLSKNLSTILGARFNYAKVDASEIDPDPADAYPFYPFTHSYNSTVGSARFSYKPNESVNLIIGVSQGFRAPNLSDTTAFQDARTSTVDVPAPDLEPEQSISYEVGAKVKDKKLEGALFWFYSDLIDFIRRVPTTYQGQEYADPPLNTIRYWGKENFAQGYIQGVELEAKYKIDKAWSIFGSFCWTEGRGDDLVGGVRQTTHFSRIPPVKTILGIRWESEKEKCFFEAHTVIADKQDKLAPEDKADTSRIPPGGTPGYVIYNARGGVTVTDTLKVSAAVENITDKDYRVHGSGINGAGTNFIFSVDLRF
jgi:hemoglobin/transferrin/lactoferrin receptor protein